MAAYPKNPNATDYFIHSSMRNQTMIDSESKTEAPLTRLEELINRTNHILKTLILMDERLEGIIANADGTSDAKDKIDVSHETPPNAGSLNKLSDTIQRQNAILENIDQRINYIQGLI